MVTRFFSVSMTTALVAEAHREKGWDELGRIGTDRDGRWARTSAQTFPNVLSYPRDIPLDLEWAAAAGARRAPVAGVLVSIWLLSTRCSTPSAMSLAGPGLV